ncbi:DnaB-like helicase C-terminal domain-containing protein [Streptosporangium sp. NPDC048865]|uniref:DnaB-like helicase C-terminal domain-containing protein n=1 Tax=Streptosporangium sp. NPDC048865 TaxID=3155766 RepID=UPI00343355A2
MPYDPAPAPAREEFLGLLKRLDLTDQSGTGHLRGRPPGHVLTGITDLDTLLISLPPGTLTVVASRPGVGSTTLLLAFCRGAAFARDTPTLLVSYESSRRDLLTRLISAEARVTGHALRSGALRDDDRTALARVVPRLAEAPLHLATPADWTLSELSDHIIRACDADGPAARLVAVDGLRHIRPDARGGTREREVTETVHTLKALAVRLEIPIVVSADLDRPPGADRDRLPDLHTDLCDAVARTADLVVLAHREDAAERDSSRAGEADLIVAKHRNGPTATITVAFQGHYGRFVDMPPD